MRLLSTIRQHRAAMVLAAVLLAFLLLKLYSLNFVFGDEHMYFYMSLLVARGEWPYRDFFFSHPPLQLYLAAPLYLVFGYSLGLSKLLPSLAAAVSGAHVYLIGRRLAGRLEGVIGSFLFLFSYDVLRGSSHFTGANCALALALVATYHALVGRQVVAGVVFALGTLTGVYVAPCALMLVVLLVLRSWREALRLFLTYALTCVGLGAVFAGAAGWSAFWYQIVGYNLHKIAFGYSWYDKFRNVAYLNSLAMSGFVPGIVWAACMWKARGRARGEPSLPGRIGRMGAWLNLWGGDRVAAQMLLATLTCGYFYFYSTRVDYYSYYFMLILPWMGLMTAVTAVDVVRFVLERRRGPAPTQASAARPERRRQQRAERDRLRHGGGLPGGRLWPLAVCALSLAAVGFYRQGIGKDREADLGGGTSHFTWRDSPYLPRPVNRMVRAAFWQPESTPVHPPNAVSYYLQHESRSAGRAEGFVAAVRSVCRPGERIFGEYSLGPFAAALGPCVLAANLADTNPHRWKVHQSTPQEWVDALERDHLAIAIVADGDVMLRNPVVRDYVLSTFPRTVATWDDPYVGHVELRRRREPEAARRPSAAGDAPASPAR